jgi:hypothetical protein
MVIPVELTPDEAERIGQMAVEHGQSLADYLRDVVAHAGSAASEPVVIDTRGTTRAERHRLIYEHPQALAHLHLPVLTDEQTRR